MAELAALQRPPSISDTFTRLTPDSKLTFESHAWLITLDPATGALLPSYSLAAQVDCNHHEDVTVHSVM